MRYTNAMMDHSIFVDDKHMAAYMRMGEALERTGELEEALSVYMKALDINPRFPTLHRSIGRAYVACAQRYSTIPFTFYPFIHLIDLLIDCVVTHDIVTSGYKAYLALQKEEDARVEQDRLSRLKSQDNPELDRLRPLPSDDHHSLKRLPRTSPKSTLRNIGFSISTIALMAMGAKQIASLDYVRSCLISSYNSLTTALQNDPNDAEAHYLTAFALLFLDGNRSTINHAKVLWSLDRAIQLEPSHANAHFLRGFALQRDKKLEQALDEYQLALDADSNHLHALQARAYLHFLRGDRLKSAQAYSRILGLNPDAHFKAVIHANRGLVTTHPDHQYCHHFAQSPSFGSYRRIVHMMVS
jgi:tetratricopeptide (TPR) repeat protein